MSNIVSENEPVNKIENETESVNNDSSESEQTLMLNKPAAFFHVSLKKFVIMFVATLGMYQLYWFFKQWSELKQHYQLEVWPAARAIFAIFYTHSLFTHINKYIKEDGREYFWPHSMGASIYVALVIFSAVLSQVYGKLSTSILIGLASIALTVLSLIPLYKAQEVINFALQGSEYKENDKLTAANGLWIILGGCYWLFVGLGVYASFIIQ